MGVYQYIKKRKEAFRQAKLRRVAVDSSKEAEKLKKLKEERLALEGKAKLQKMREMEEARIRKAKGPSKLQRFSTGFNKAYGEMKKRGGKRKSGFSAGGSKGIDFGGDSSKYAYGKKKKKKERYVTIKIKR